jgi:hypothetical protein
MRTYLLSFLPFLILSLVACGRSDLDAHRRTNMPTPEEKARIEENLAFTCAYEKDRVPELDPDAELLYKHAVWLGKKNILKKDTSVYPVIDRLYRIAAANGHYKAAHNLISMMMGGKSTANDATELPVELAEDMIKRGIPQGYYDMGYLLSQGYGVKLDPKAAQIYFRKAADLGSPDAQYYVGRKLRGLGFTNPVPFKVGTQMIKCAGDQGHTDAAQETGIDLKLDGHGAEAIKYFQLAIKAGSSTGTLENAFAGRVPALPVQKDEERSRRYEIISNTLEGYSYANPTVEELDEIVPLPPAKLPPWDGTIKWLKEWKANVPPPLPSEDRIAEMALAKGLDPVTGRPGPDTRKEVAKLRRMRELQGLDPDTGLRREKQ